MRQSQDIDMSDRSLRLATATRPAHLRLHRSGPFHRIATGRYDRADVCAALTLHLASWQGAALLDPGFVSSAFGPDREDFFRLGQLREAIKGLDSPCLQPSALVFPCPQVAVIAAIYVFLGSQKGGRILNKRLCANGFDAAGACFLPGPDHDRDWAVLHRLIEDLPDPKLAALFGSANLWFGAFVLPGDRFSAPTARAQKVS